MSTFFFFCAIEQSFTFSYNFFMQIGETKFSSRHWATKEKVLALRKNGASYNDIASELSVSKSTISVWCRHIKLTDAQYKNLYSRRNGSINGVIAIQKMFWAKRCEAFEKGLEFWKKFGTNTNFVAGLMLYWAEGTKTTNVAVINSDSEIIKFMVSWFDDFFQVSSQFLVVHLNLHSGQDELAIKKYWSELTGIRLENFKKSFIKPEGSGYRKKILYNGTVRLRIKGQGSTYKLFTIFGCLADFLHDTNGKSPNLEDRVKKLPYA